MLPCDSDDVAQDRTFAYLSLTAIPVNIATQNVYGNKTKTLR